MMKVTRGLLLRTTTVAAAAATMALTCPARAAEERVAMPPGAFVCKAIEPTIEHARIARPPTTAGLREYVEAQTGSGACRVIKAEVERWHC